MIPRDRELLGRVAELNSHIPRATVTMLDSLLGEHIPPALLRELAEALEQLAADIRGAAALSEGELAAGMVIDAEPAERRRLDS